MAKQNLAILYGRIYKEPLISYTEEGEPVKATIKIDTIKGVRHIQDNNTSNAKHNIITCVTKKVEVINIIKELQKNDIVSVKGVVCSTIIPKKSYCNACVEAGMDPQEVMQIVNGIFVYVNPIHLIKHKSYDNEEDAILDVMQNREMSNIVAIYGQVCSEPKLFITKNKTSITQYQLAIPRKYKIIEDDISRRIDWPWVKSYGEQAIEDKMRIKKGTELILDGFLQRRSVVRTSKCPSCGQFYQWDDSSMEIVPYAVEYIKGTYRSDHKLEQERQKNVEEILQEISSSLHDKDVSEDYNIPELQQ